MAVWLGDSTLSGVHWGTWHADASGLPAWHGGGKRQDKNTASDEERLRRSCGHCKSSCGMRPASGGVKKREQQMERRLSATEASLS